MTAGAVLMAEFYVAPKQTTLTWGEFGQITLPQALGVNHWIVIAVFVVLFLLFFRWAKKKGL
jgi:hypothetical protein